MPVKHRTHVAADSGQWAVGAGLGNITEALASLLYLFAMSAHAQQASVPSGRGQLRHGSGLRAGGAVGQQQAARRSMGATVGAVPLQAGSGSASGGWFSL